jgi:hypothetical protein
VPQSVVLSYAWLNLAAARASGHERDFYRRLRDAVEDDIRSNRRRSAARFRLDIRSLVKAAAAAYCKIPSTPPSSRKLHRAYP